MMKTFFLELIPSISVRTWLMTLSAAPPAMYVCIETLGKGVLL
jgi:hypothetical protein